MICSCNWCSHWTLNKCLSDETFIHLDPEFEKEIEGLDETEDLPDNDILTFVEKTHVGLRSSTQFEQFYIFFVTNVDKAENDKSDVFGYVVEKGELHLIGYILEKIKEHKKKVFYKKIMKEVYVHARELFIPLVSIDENDTSVEKSEYVYLSYCALVSPNLS